MNVMPLRSARLAWRHLLWLGCCVTLLAGETGRANAQPPASREYQIKAIFLLNFGSFVDWPPGAFATPSAPITIGVLGADPFGAVLDEAVNGETVQNRRVLVRRADRVADLRGCQIVFIGASEQRRLSETLDALDRAPVLTVSDLPGFAREGGVIGFYIDANKVRFEINPASAARHGIKLSSQLLSLARIVEPTDR